MDSQETPHAPSSLRLFVAQAVAFVLAVELAAAAVEFGDRGTDVTRGWWMLWLLAVGPVLWFVRWKPTGNTAPQPVPVTVPGTGERGSAGGAAVPGGTWRAWGLAALVGLVSFDMSWWTADAIGDLPPGIHDEQSYVFQAETFLAGRTWFPSHPSCPELFDQMHVLNEGKFASRYSPGTGLWIAPFLAVGYPYVGHWLAGALTAMLVFAAGRELAGDACGLIAGFITALSPGMAIFGNLLLAHHPTLVGLGVFWWAFLRMRNLKANSTIWRRAAWAGTAGCGLAWAMLCRPLTAAGVGLPFGIWFLWWIFRVHRPVGGSPEASRSADAGPANGRTLSGRVIAERLTVAVAMGLPILAGLALLFAYNRSITGNGWLSPWQLYNDVYTPRHVYGFNNAVRGAMNAGPRVLHEYDQWARNLTVPLGFKNVQTRLAQSLEWTLGVIPLAMAAALFLFGGFERGRGWWLIGAAIVSLHAAYFPYWFVGISAWHYVFETGPLWGLLFGGATVTLVRAWRSSGRFLLPVWWGLLAVAPLAFLYLPIGDRPSPFATQLEGSRTMRQPQARFRQLIAEQVADRPALVLVDDPPENSIDDVVNSPGLDADVLVGRFRRGSLGLDEIIRRFPDRAVYRYDRFLRRIDRVGTQSHNSHE